MANRASFDSNGLKVSRPGYNVLTAADRYLQFDSSAAHANVLMRGSISIGKGTSGTVYFGKTFTTMPIVFWAAGHGTTEHRQFIGSAEYIVEYDFVSIPIIFSVFVFQNRFEWWHRDSWNELADGTFRYVVFDNNA